MTPQQEQEYLDSISMQLPQGAAEKYMRAKDPILAAIDRPNAQRDALIAQNKVGLDMAQAMGVSPDRQQGFSDIVRERPAPQSAAQQYAAAKTPQQTRIQKDMDYLTKNLGLNADNYATLLGRGAFDPNNAAVKQMVAGFAPKEVVAPEQVQVQGGNASYAPQAQPKMDGTGGGHSRAYVKGFGQVDTGGVQPSSVPNLSQVESYEQPQVQSFGAPDPVAAQPNSMDAINAAIVKARNEIRETGSEQAQTNLDHLIDMRVNMQGM